MEAMSNTTSPVPDRPKITVRSKNSLYILSYSDIDSKDSRYNECRLRICNTFNISFFIDIPTIDYYNDELNDSKLSKFNKKFKLNLLKNQICDSFVNNNNEFWNQLVNYRSDSTNKPLKCNLNINTSGSLRYVETIKFLIETLYQTLSTNCENLKLKININVSHLTKKWYKTFLNEKLLKSNIINFIKLDYHHYKDEKIQSLLSHKEAITKSPFKEYFTKLNSKFTCTSIVPQETFESITIVTNSTGIKALLTILSDKPLTNFISQESISALYNNNLDINIKKSKIELPEKETIKRESLSLINFQNSLITSNKDKSVRIRSLSTTSKPANHNNNNKIISSISNSNSNSQSSIPNIETTTANDYVPLSPNNNILRTSSSSNSIVNSESSREDEALSHDEYENNTNDLNDSESDDEESDEDGISFYVPSLLSRTASNTNIPEPSTEPITSTTMKKGRFRSLSLMDPALKTPFNQFDLLTMSKEGQNVNSRSFSNIYVHDGNFVDPIRPLKRNIKRKYTLSGNHNIPKPGTGLIPPEFYELMSSPPRSNSGSTGSLNNMLASPQPLKLFEKNLINNSFEEIRNINNLASSSNHNTISPLLGHNQLHPFGLNFNRGHSRNHSILSSLDEEDKLMMGETPEQQVQKVSETTSKSEATEAKPTSFDLKLYDDSHHEDKDKKKDTTKPNFKKIMSFNLYGDRDQNNNNNWVLGFNA